MYLLLYSLFYIPNVFFIYSIISIFQSDIYEGQMECEKYTN